MDSAGIPDGELVGDVPPSGARFHYKVAQSTVSRLIRRITPILSRRLRDFVLEENLPATALLVDGTLIPTGNRISRPELYSGRHHRTGMNVQVVADLAGREITTFYPVSSSISDLSAFRAWGLTDRLTSRTPSRTRAASART